MHSSGARTFTVRPWLVNEGTMSVRLEQMKLGELKGALNTSV